MTVVDMRLDWVKAQAGYRPPREGLMVTATRAGVFTDPPDITILHVLPAQTYDLTATPLNLLVSSTEDLGINPAFLPAPSSVPTLHNVGTLVAGTARRVYQYIDSATGLDFRLGLTVHSARGTWSSEPHTFETEALKDLKPMAFWEQFAYLTQPRNKWGIQTRQGFIDGQITHGIELIRDRDILSIPLGTHPVTAGPGVMLAYIWVYQADDITVAEKF